MYDETNSITTTKGYIIPLNEVHNFYELSTDIRCLAFGETGKYSLIESMDGDYFVTRVNFDDLIKIYEEWSGEKING